MSSSLLPKYLKIKIYRTIILTVVLYGYETWSLRMKAECRLRVFENRVLRRIFELKRDEGTGEWRKLHNEELNDLYSSPNVIQVVKLGRMRWVGHVACMGDRRGSGFWWGNLRERDYLDGTDVDERIILRWILRKWDGGAGTGLIWVRIGTGGRHV